MGFAWAGDAAGQTLTSGALTGTVRTANGAVLSGVLVTATNTTTGISRSATTDFRGIFEFRQLGPATYDLFAERLGYRPVRVRQIPVRVGGRAEVTIDLNQAAPPVDSVEVMEYAGGALRGSRPGLSEWFPAFAFDLPHARREVGELLRLSGVSGPELTVEGLPARLSMVAVDAVPYRSGRQRVLETAATFPMLMFEEAELLTNPVDVEWSGFAGGVLNAHTRRGGREFEAEGFAAWSGAPGSAAETFDPGSLSFADLQGGAFISGPLAGDSARFALGFSGRRYESPEPAAWQNTALAGSVVSTVRNQFGLELGDFVAPHVARTEAMTVFGRVDWQIGERHALDMRLSYATVPEASARTGLGSPFLLTNPLKTDDFIAGVTLRSEFSSTITNELRLGGSSGSAEYGDDALGQAELPLTVVVPESLVFGTNGLEPQRWQHRDLQLANAVTVAAGTHDIKIGGAFEGTSIQETPWPGSRATVFFGGANELANARGVAIHRGAASGAEFSTNQWSVFLQDTWRPQRGIEVVAGVRYEQESVPQDEVILNTAWQSLTGLANNDLTKPEGRISPRFSVRWDVDEQHTWIFRAAGGIYFDRVDPALLSEVITLDGRVPLRRHVGLLGWWPQNPPPDTGRQFAELSMLAPNFQAPRSTRASFGLTRALGSNGALHLAGVWRETSNLPRRADLNRPTTPLVRDQHGRPVYGTLLQQGELLVADPGSNRRFDSFDVVYAINADGQADYRAVSAGLEWFGERVDVLARYTYSQATDDWLTGAIGGVGAVDPGLDEQFGAAWSEGTADLDVPHRLAIGAQVKPVDGLRVSGVYRYRSGYPFTPGFPVGVDINGDGLPNNDPAFVSDLIAGTNELISRFDCLRSQVGRFAERNSCRGDGVHSFDARVGFALRWGKGEVELHGEALNLIQSEAGLPDAALYRADAGGQLVTTGGTVDVPLVANPQFGETRVPLVPARVLRFGISLKW